MRSAASILAAPLVLSRAKGVIRLDTRAIRRKALQEHQKAQRALDQLKLDLQRMEKERQRWEELQQKRQQGRVKGDGAPDWDEMEEDERDEEWAEDEEEFFQVLEEMYRERRARRVPVRVLRPASRRSRSCIARLYSGCILTAMDR